MNLELTEQEAQILVNLIDEAVKTKGLSVAEAGLYFLKKIKEAATPNSIQSTNDDKS